MGRPRKRRCHETKTNESAKDLDPFSCLDGNFPIEPYLDNSGPSFENGQMTATSTFGLYGGVNSMVENNRALWHFGAGNPNAPMSLGGQPDAPVEPIIPQNAQRENPQVPAPPCSCLDTMYLAMSSLKELPSEFGAALAAVRSAANTAQLVLRCDQCGRCMGPPIQPPIDALQNTMLLATLLPTIVNCYKKLLEMVDHEASMAKVAGYQIEFYILQDDTIFGPSGMRGEAESLEHALMDPDDWRSAVHRILRNDIYGDQMATPGLKSIISEMEERQRRGHTKMDTMSNSGLFNDFQQRHCLGERNAPCLQILNVTKVAMESLTIP